MGNACICNKIAHNLPRVVDDFYAHKHGVDSLALLSAQPHTVLALFSLQKTLKDVIIIA